MTIPDFTNTEIAFRRLSDTQLWKARLLFEGLGREAVSSWLQAGAKAALKLHLPVSWIIKNSIFEQFCGGESIGECLATIEELRRFGAGTILDYAAEGMRRQEDFDKVCSEVAATIELAAGDRSIPFCVFKVTGLGRFEVLEKASAGGRLSGPEAKEFDGIRVRVERLCRLALARKVRVLIDAEESWIQDAVDHLAETMMQACNRDWPCVYNTVQLYRRDRLHYLEKLLEAAAAGGYHAGVKLVRGAYLEKESARAARLGYPSPLHTSKADVDRDYDLGLELCIRHIATAAVCAGTHNEESTRKLAGLMRANGLEAGDKRVEFSQLLGMSDHLTFNLTHAGYNASKYVPYGSVRTLVPYLIRRAEENSSIKGQMGRELTMIRLEQQRRSGAGRIPAAGISNRS